MNGDNKLIACWSDLRELYNLESNDLCRQSSLKEVAVYPKPIKRQNVATCLKVFCDRTLAALKSHAGIDKELVQRTIVFIELFGFFWKVVSNKEIYGDQRHNDPLEKPISTKDNYNLKILAEIADQMFGKQGKGSNL